MKLNVFSKAITSTGSAGSATGSGTLSIPVAGYVEWVYLDYHASAPATSDVTLANAGTPPGGNILVVSNNATDGLYFPRGGAVTVAGAAITDSHDKIAIAGDITLSIAQSDALTNVVTAYVAISS